MNFSCAIEHRLKIRKWDSLIGVLQLKIYSLTASHKLGKCILSFCSAIIYYKVDDIGQHFQKLNQGTIKKISYEIEQVKPTQATIGVPKRQMPTDFTPSISTQGTTYTTPTTSNLDVCTIFLHFSFHLPHFQLCSAVAVAVGFFSLLAFQLYQLILINPLNIIAVVLCFHFFRLNSVNHKNRYVVITSECFIIPYLILQSS